MVGVIELEGEAENCRNRGEGDVTLVPVESYTNNFLAVPVALANNAGINQCGRVGSGLRRRQCKAGNLVARGEARQVSLFLFVRAVMQQKFGRSERIRYAYR